MTDEQKKKPGLAFYATVVVVIVLVLYPLSFGPACWVVARMQDYPDMPAVYRPGLLMARRVRAIDSALQWYANLGSPRYGEWRFDVGDPAWMAFPSP
jgi:hypothetical protein